MSVPRALLDSICDQLQNLSLRVGVLERRADRAENRSEAVGSTSEFEVISGAASSVAEVAGGEGSQVGDVLVSDLAGRRQLAAEIGLFLQRCVRGEHRGTSGRDRLKLQNRIYVVLADFEGNLLSEPRVESSFAPVKALCKRGSDPGRAIFVGFPTKWEAKLALQTGGFAVAQALLVLEDGSSREQYDIVSLSFVSGAGEDKVINLIPIAIINGKLLVAIPLGAWHKTASKRLLPRTLFTRPVKVEVLAVSSDEPAECLDCAPLRLWVGYLDASLFPGLEVGASPIADGDISDVLADGTEAIPYGPGLAEVADQHFAFLTAISGAPDEEAEGDQEVAEVEEEVGVAERLKFLESSLAKIQESLSQLTPPQQPAPAFVTARAKPAPAPRPSALRNGSKKDKPGGKATLLPGLDPAVVSSARAAGIPEDQLHTLSRLVSKSNHMEDAPLPGRKPATRTNVLSETEEEDLEEGEEDAEDLQEAEESGPMERAVVQLTRIVDKLAQGKDKKNRDVEALLDGVDCDGAEPSTSGGGKSKAAVYKKLKACLRDNPKFLYQTIEGLMEEDFHAIRQAPGASNQATSWRAWLEHRSRVGHYPTTVRYCWILAGILDAIQAGALAEARTRAALGLLAADQAALDNGSWLMAQEVLFQEPPPLNSFKGKSNPESWEQSSSKLMDERWLDVLMWKIN
eukprot:s1444_g15.t1